MIQRIWRCKHCHDWLSQYERPRCRKCKDVPFMEPVQQVTGFGVRERPPGSRQPDYYVVIASGKNGCGQEELPFEIKTLEVAQAMAKAFSNALKEVHDA